jgi:hypothetical protein
VGGASDRAASDETQALRRGLEYSPTERLLPSRIKACEHHDWFADLTFDVSLHVIFHERRLLSKHLGRAHVAWKRLANMNIAEARINDADNAA